MGETETQIRDLILEEVAGDPSLVLTPETALIDEGIIDSLGIIQLVKALEESFAITIEVEDVVADNFASIATLRDLVESKRAAAGA